MALKQIAFLDVSLSSGISTGTGATIPLSSYALLNSNLVDGDTIYLVLERTSSTLREIILVTRSGASSYTMTARGLFGTTEQAHDSGKEVTCDDVPGYWDSTIRRPSALTATRVPFADANGDLVDDSDLTFATDTLTSTKIVATRRVTSGVVALTDGATVALDASLGNTFTLSAAGNRTILTPSNAVSGQKITIAHTASGGARTLALTTGSAGAFRFGTDITALTATGSGLTDYIGAIYNAGADRWDVVAVIKGF